MSNSFLIFASILFAAFLGLSFIQLTKLFDPAHHGHHDKIVNGFPIPELAVGGSDEEVFITPISIRLADANPALGPKAAAKCTTCHAFEQGGVNKIGPALWNIVGRDIASDGTYSYSGALAGIDGDWTAEALDGFLLKPKAWAPGTKMGFAGLKDEADRANLIAWMYQRADAPLALPEPSAEDLAAVEAHSAATAAAE
ncbi:MAG: cytochrome c family protein [Kiloniella sp.]|nr:cytochrome c family protein [Kiloniella sp.]